jgi:hypothetical protein
MPTESTVNFRLPDTLVVEKKLVKEAIGARFGRKNEIFKTSHWSLMEGQNHVYIGF